MDPVRRVFVCLNEDCYKRGNEFVYSDLCQACEGRNDLEIREYICFGNCENGANVVVYPDRVWFSGLRKDKAKLVLDYLNSGRLPEGHSPEIEAELADTVYELLALQDEGTVSENAA